MNDSTPSKLFPNNESDLVKLVHNSVLCLLTRTVGHEINNQLTGIFGYLTLAQSKSKSQAKQKNYLNQISTCCENSQRLINTVFVHSDNSSFTDIVQTFRTVESVFSLLFKNDYSFEFELASDISSRHKAQNGAQSVLMFFLLVAKESCTAGGSARVSCSRRETDSGDERFHVEIDMNGRDMKGCRDPHEIMNEELCFTFGWQAIRALLPQWDATLEINSREEGSQSIQLTFPCRSEDSDGNAISPRSEPAPVRFIGAPKILLLEDQEAISRYIHELMQGEGFESIVFKSGHQLGDALSRLDLDSFDLFVLDIFVPGSSGLDLAMRIRDRKPNAKILFYSALTDMETVVKLFPINSTTAFMPKPFKNEEFLQQIHTMLAAEAV